MMTTILYIEPAEVDFYTATHGVQLVVEVEYEVGAHNNLLDYYVNAVGITKGAEVIDIMSLVEDTPMWDAIEGKAREMVEGELEAVADMQYDRARDDAALELMEQAKAEGRTP